MAGNYRDWDSYSSLGQQGHRTLARFRRAIGALIRVETDHVARGEALRAAPCCYFAPGDVLPLTEPAGPLVDVPLTEPVDPVSVLAPPLAVTPPDDSTLFEPAPAAPLLFPLPELGDKAVLPDVPVLPDDAEPGAGLVVTAPVPDVPASVLEPEQPVIPDDDPVPLKPLPTAAVPRAPLSVCANASVDGASAETNATVAIFMMSSCVVSQGK